MLGSLFVTSCDITWNESLVAWMQSQKEAHEERRNAGGKVSDGKLIITDFSNPSTIESLLNNPNVDYIIDVSGIEETAVISIPSGVQAKSITIIGKVTSADGSPTKHTKVTSLKNACNVPIIVENLHVTDQMTATAGELTVKGNVVCNGGVSVNGAVLNFHGTVDPATGSTIGCGISIKNGTGHEINGTVKSCQTGVTLSNASNVTLSGTVSSCTGDESSGNAAVVIEGGSNVTMTGSASIIGNTCTGVNITAATLIMSGGKIDNNTITLGDSSSHYGGGVCLSSGTFTMSGGTISNNTLAWTNGEATNYTPICGAGVYATGGTFTLDGGTIEQNTLTYPSGASDYYNACGAGVYVAEYCTFKMTSGKITNNKITNAKKHQYSAGLYLEVAEESNATSMLTGGSITDNTCEIPGGEQDSVGSSWYICDLNGYVDVEGNHSAYTGTVYWHWGSAENVTNVSTIPTEHNSNRESDKLLREYSYIPNIVP